MTGTGGGTPCDYSNTNEGGIMAAGGTSFVAPQFNGVIALINQASSRRQGQANYKLYAMASHEYGIPGLPNILPFVPSVVTCESNYLSIAEFSRVFPSCVFYDIYRTPDIGTAICSGFHNSNCVVDGNDMVCATGSTDCFTGTAGDAYRLLSISTSKFEPAWYQSAGFSDAVGLGSFNITNLVKNWSKPSWFVPFVSSTAVSASSGTITAAGKSVKTTTLTATVTASGRGSLAPPMGTVNFYASEVGASDVAAACGEGLQGLLNLLGASALAPGTGNATAVLSGLNSLQLGGFGTHTVIACFSGDGANDAPSACVTSVTVDE